MGEIKDAVERYADRKRAALGHGDSGEVRGSETMKLTIVGLDIDLDELHDYRIMAAAAAVQGIKSGELSGMDPLQSMAHALAGMWVDGLVTGIIMQEAREDG